MLGEFIRRYFMDGMVERARDDLARGLGTRKEVTAVAVLLVEAARMDATFAKKERTTIESILAERFGLTGDEVRKVIANAEATAADTTQYFPFTHHINQSMSEKEKSEIIEMLWRVAYADGELDPDEDALIRQLAGLIYVTDRERALARRRALETLKDDGAQP